MHVKTVSDRVHFAALESGRTYPELDRDLKPMLEKIRSNVQKRLCWTKVAIPVTKKVFKSVILEPGTTTFKIGVCLGTGYIIYLLMRGTIAGIEVDNDSNIADIFSKNETVRLNAGLNLTNGDQAGQFLMDSVFMGYATFRLIVREHYHKSAGELINDCYKPHLIKMLNKIHKIEIKIINNENRENNYNLMNKLIKHKEDVNQLYQYLKEDLKPYGVEPIVYGEAEDIHSTENKEVIIDIKEQN